MIPLIYIAGPFRGPTPLDVRRNVEAARDLGMAVAQAGAYPMIPHTMTADFDKQLSDEFWLTGTLEMLKRCDAIVSTANWEQSKGAVAEINWAVDHDMPWMVYTDMGVHGGLRKDRLREFVAQLLRSSADKHAYLRMLRAGLAGEGGIR